MKKPYTNTISLQVWKEFVNCFKRGCMRHHSRRIVLEPGSSWGNRRSQLIYVAVLHLRQCHYIKELSTGYCSMNSWWRSPSAMSWQWRRCGWSNVMITAHARRLERKLPWFRSTRPHTKPGSHDMSSEIACWMQFISEYARRPVHTCTPRTHR